MISSNASPRSDQQLDQKYWEEHLSDESRLQNQIEWLTYSRAIYASWVRQYLDSGDRVLKTDAFEEIRGKEISDALLERFSHVAICDLALPALRQASWRQTDQRLLWIQTPAQTQPFADASFDAVTSFSTLDHFRTTAEIGQGLRELARVTRPGGQLLITLDNARNPVITARNFIPNRLLRKVGLAPYEYGQTLGPRAFQQALQESGWRIKHFTAVVHEPRVLAVALSRFCHADGLLNPSRYRALLRPFAKLESLPTRLFTGHFLLAVGERQP